MKTLKTIALSLALFLNFNCSSEELQTESTTSNEENQNISQRVDLLQAGSYSIKRYVFSRSNGASGLGHVGVGVEVRTTNPTTVRFYSGAVENSSGSIFIPIGGNNAGWNSAKTSFAGMFNEFKSRGYDYYKFTKSFADVSNTRAQNTINEINYLPGRGYWLTGNNCMNATYDVLNQGGGLFLPAPSVTVALYAPNVWFNALVPINGWSGQVAM